VKYFAVIEPCKEKKQALARKKRILIPYPRKTVFGEERVSRTTAEV
jgi:hypothetical protein